MRSGNQSEAVESLKINPHDNWAGDFLPAVMKPEFPAARIVVCNQDQRSFETGSAQTAEAFIHQLFAESAGLVGRINRQMINISAPTVVTAQYDTNNRSAVSRHSAQSRVAREKVGNAFPVIALGNLETLNPLPQFERRTEIPNGKFSRFDIAGHFRSESVAPHAASGFVKHYVAE
jgi:hypothetical protein